MTQEDLDRENRIDAWLLRLCSAKTAEERSEAFKRMLGEIKLRSPSRVAEMERKRGLK